MSEQLFSIAESLWYFPILPDRCSESNAPSRRRRQICSSLRSDLQELVRPPLSDLLDVRYPNRPGRLILTVANAVAELCEQLAYGHTRWLLTQDGRCNVTHTDRSLGLGEVENTTSRRLRT